MENRKIDEISPIYRKRINDIVIENKNNSTIILGLDREPSSYADDAGIDNAHPGSATIDIVTGRAGRDPNYENDKSRILVSSKTNADSNFGLKHKKQVLDNEDGSAFIAMKSDSVRILSRKSTRIQSIDGGSATFKKNGDVVIRIPGKLFLGSDSSDEPLVLGNICVSFLNSLLQLILLHTHGTGTGPSTPPINAANFTELLNNYIVNRKIVSNFSYTQKEPANAP